jgi:3-dehydrosphinganine reductase
MSSFLFKEMMKINYLGTVYCCKSVINSMKSRKFGRIAFVSSDCGQMGIFGYAAYCASKFALKGFAESLQMEVKPYNIQLIMSFPPDTLTPGLLVENKNKV